MVEAVKTEVGKVEMMVGGVDLEDEKVVAVIQVEMLALGAMVEMAG